MELGMFFKVIILAWMLFLIASVLIQDAYVRLVTKDQAEPIEEWFDEYDAYFGKHDDDDEAFLAECVKKEEEK